MKTSEAFVVAGNAENMRAIGDSSVKLVLTSPPFFDSRTELLLRLPRTKHQALFSEVQEGVLSFARQLKQAFAEIKRVLHPDGTFILHTKDLRFGDALIPLAAEHEKLARDCGFYVATRVYWVPSDRPRRSGKDFRRRPTISAFRAIELETYSVMRLSAPKTCRPRIELSTLPWPDEPVWKIPGETETPRHPHAGSPEVMRRLVTLFSSAGDTILDPFCGGGGLLALAREMDRNAIGYEIDRQYVEMARDRLQR